MDEIPSLLSSDKPADRMQAARLLGEIKTAAAAERLVPLLNDWSAQVRRAAHDALRGFGHPALPQLVDLLVTGDNLTNPLAFDILYHMPDPDLAYLVQRFRTGGALD